MKYFIDTEFIEGFRKPLFGKKRHFIDLISIGIIAEDGREYYAISNEYSYNKADEWVKKNVIIPMYLDTVHGDNRNRWDAMNFNRVYGKSNKQIAEEIISFINNEPIKTHKYANVVLLDNESAKGIKNGYVSPEFYGYYADYDWVLFCSLFGRMIDLPKGFPMYCKDLKQYFDDRQYMEKYDLKKQPNYPKQQNEHNALADAKWNFELFKFLQTVNQ